MRRVLRRARDGATLNVDEATTLLHARGADLEDLCASAAKVRDAGLLAAGRPNTVSYSRKVFVPITRLCRDKCHYCTFVTVPGKLRAAGHGMYLEPDEILEIARQGAELGCKEALFTLGDRPEDRWPEAKQWLDERGYDSTLDYVRAMSIRVLEETGLLPHLNPGVMSWEEISRLKPVAPSMGMMLETTSTRLFTDKGECHYGSPDKDPEVRLRTLTDAGRLSVPFTTGILVGIGETLAERAESIMAIRKLHKAFGHVQEVIVQNFLAKPDTAMRDAPTRTSRSSWPPSRSRACCWGRGCGSSRPPNLVSEAECLGVDRRGCRRLGRGVAAHPDHVNPERPWPNLDSLAAITAQAGYTLVERTAAQPQYVLAGHPWIDPRIGAHVRAVADPVTGLARADVKPAGLPWQEPDEEWVSSGRVDLNTEIDTDGRNTETRSDLGSAFGDWETVREQVLELGRAAPARVDTDVLSALRSAERDPATLSDDEYLALATADGDGLEAVIALADALRKDAVGDDVTYVVNRNINFTNICYTGCRFCAFAQRKGDADAFTFVGRGSCGPGVGGARRGRDRGLHAGRHRPRAAGHRYADLVRAVKRRVPSMHVHAFSPMEIVNGASRGGQSVRDWLTELRAAGLDTIPGTAAEILDDEVRCPHQGQAAASAWIDVVHHRARGGDCGRVRR